MKSNEEVHALVVDADGNASLGYIGSDLASIKEHLDGGYLEALSPSTDDFGNWHAYVDEEGRLKGLPVNVNATVIAKALGWTGDFIVGPAVFLGTDGSDPHAEGDLPMR